MDHKNKVALITGGANGIGRATTEIFVREGARVILLDIDKKAGLDIQRQFPQVLFLQTNVTQAAAIEAAVETGMARFGRIDYLVNNAGIIHYASATTCDEADWDRVMNVNLKAAFLCSKYVIPCLQKNDAGGVIINVASAQAFISSANMVHYTTSKSALLGLTRSLAIDYAPHIRTVAVCPGTVDTPMARNAWATAANPVGVHQESMDMHLLKRIATAGEVGELIVFLCSNRSAFITGQAIRIDGGLGIAVPGSVND